MKGFGLRIVVLAAFCMVCGMMNLGAQASALKIAKPVKLSIIDVAGNLQLSKPAIEAFKAANPKLVADIEYIKLTAPELSSKLKAQQMAGNLDTTMVLTGYDGMAAGIEQGIYVQVIPKYKDDFQKTIDELPSRREGGIRPVQWLWHRLCLLPGRPHVHLQPGQGAQPAQDARRAPGLGKGQPRQVHVRPPGELWPRAAPSSRACPTSSGTRTRRIPQTWDKTWAFLKELDKYIDYYPSGTAITFKELAEGTRWIIWRATSAGT